MFENCKFKKVEKCCNALDSHNSLTKNDKVILRPFLESPASNLLLSTKLLWFWHVQGKKTSFTKLL